MNKFIKLGKRILALFIVVLLNVNTYAAVGANDGSAFVTKAEFDALVNTFNEQMDSYQSGLNSKIDGAIANYLAGLSSQQTSEVPFYDGLGSGAFVVNFDKLNDLIVARGEIDITMNSNWVGRGSGGYSSTCGDISLNRRATDVRGGEAFVIKDGKVELGGNDIRPSIRSSGTVYYPNNWGGYTYSKNYVPIRLRGYASGNDTEIARGLDGYWIGFYGSGVIWGARWQNTKLNLETTVTLSQHDNVRTIFDNSRDGDDQVFSNYENDGNYNNKFGFDWVNDTETYYKNYEKDNSEKDSKVVYQQLSDAKINPTGRVSMVGNIQQTTNDRIVSSVNVVYEGSSGSETGNTEYADWYRWREPVLKLELDDAASILQQSYTEDLLKKYNPKYSDASKTNNWRGYLTQGIPICRFDDSGKATFELDTTPLGGNVGAASVIAFSTKAFERTAVLDTFARDEKITAIKVDNNTVSGGSISLTPGKHEFEIHMTPASGGDTLFMKVAYPSSVTTSIRNVFTLPKTVMLSLG